MPKSISCHEGVGIISVRPSNVSNRIALKIALPLRNRHCQSAVYIDKRMHLFLTPICSYLLLFATSFRYCRLMSYDETSPAAATVGVGLQWIGKPTLDKRNTSAWTTSTFLWFKKCLVPASNDTIWRFLYLFAECLFLYSKCYLKEKKA